MKIIITKFIISMIIIIQKVQIKMFKDVQIIKVKINKIKQAKILLKLFTKNNKKNNLIID